MIVIIGSTALGGVGPEAVADGLPADIGRAAVADGAQVELIGKIGDDPAGDALMVALARAGIGHVATLRDPSRATVVRLAAADDAVEALDPAPSESTVARPATDRSAGLAPVLEAADVGLALRYVTDFGVVVAVHVPTEVLAEAAAASAWAEAHLVVVVEPGSGIPAGLAADALVVEMVDTTDADEGATDATGMGSGTGVGAGVLLGRYAAAVDRGDDRAAAYAAMTAAATAGSG